MELNAGEQTSLRAAPSPELMCDVDCFRVHACACVFMLVRLRLRALARLCMCVCKAKILIQNELTLISSQTLKHTLVVKVLSNFCAPFTSYL